MGIEERKLLLQIHPLNIFVNWGSRFASLYFVWNHQIGLTLFTMFIPSILVSYLIIKYIDIEVLKDTSYGKIAPTLMATGMEITRSIGLGAAIMGAWLHHSSIIILGVSIFILSWVIGLMKKPKVV